MGKAEHLQSNFVKKSLLGAWMDGWGWVDDLKAVLRIDFNNQKLANPLEGEKKYLCSPLFKIIEDFDCFRTCYLYWSALMWQYGLFY